MITSPQVKIYVGNEEKLYLFPRDLIAYYSPYFASAFRNDWKEAKGVLRLPDESTEFFDVLRDYFHRGNAKYMRHLDDIYPSAECRWVRDLTFS